MYVGSPATRRSRQTFRFSGAFSFRNRTRSPYRSSSASTAGIIAMHGGHCGPQTSTRTSPSPIRSSNVSTVASIIGLLSASPGSRTLRPTAASCGRGTGLPSRSASFGAGPRVPNARKRVREPRHRATRCGPASGRTPATRAIARTAMSSLVSSPAHHAEPGEHPVVAVGHVAAAGRLGDLRVVELGRVLVDVGDRAPHRGEGRPTMSSSSACCDVPAAARSARPRRSGRGPLRSVGRADQDGHAREHVLEDGARPAQRSLELHAELGQRAAGDHRDAVVITPDETSAPATTSAWIGAAQNALTSQPLASVRPWPPRSPSRGCRRPAGSGRRSPPRPRRSRT